MKTMKKLSFIFIVVFLFSLTTLGQVKVTSEGFLQVDYLGDQSLTFGNNAGGQYPLRGQWGIEHYNGGLNFGIPWPNPAMYGGNYKLFIQDNTGYVGINDGTPSYQLDVNGDIATYGTLRISSDERFKTDIKPISSSIEKLLKLEGVSYKMKKSKPSEYNLDEIKDQVKYQTAIAEMSLQDSITSTDRYGFIAQELMEVYPELVDQDKEGYLNIDYIGLIPILVEAIKELQERVETIENNCCNKDASMKSASITSGTTNDLTENKARLDQNIPNPFSNETKIGCYIPDGSGTSVLYIYNMNGAQLQQYSINGKGKQTLPINGNSFQPGMYLYALVIDGKEVDTKRMILTK
ncbi:MAG: tail fiber domain-containing protein [Bacteroidota bacterium]|nr:tail fiber domain-containing protein [Bacteroidota bacterium]